MSFLKITDPEKRDALVREFLATRRNIQESNLAERTSEMQTEKTASKLFKPIVESQAKIVQELVPIKEGIKTIQQLPTPPAPLPALEAPNADDELIGPIAAQYLKKFASRWGDVDRTFGIYVKEGLFYIGDQQVGVVDDNLIVGDEEYEGTRGLWELLIMSQPNNDLYNQDDYNNYAKIMVNTNALRKGNSASNAIPKANRGWKWKNLMKGIWQNKDQIQGSGLATPPVILPSDPNALLDRLDLLLASKKAGNTGVRNELVGICDELKRQKVLDRKSYKKLMSQL